MQFSLRTFLIATCVVGVAAGLLGRLFFANPQTFCAVLGLLSTSVPFLLAIGTILWMGLGGSPWSTPVCGQCKQSLPAARAGRVKLCPQCGEDLTVGSKAVLFMRRPGRRWGLFAWGIVLLLTPVLGIGTVYLAQWYAGPMPNNLRFQSTQQLIQQELPNQVDAPWVWNELASRLAAGKLSQQEVDDAVKALVAHMTATRPNGWDQPLHWSPEFLTAAQKAGMISEPVLLQLCDAFHGPKPVIQPLPRLREGKSGFSIELKHGNSWSNHTNLGLELLWQVDRLLIDGKPVQFRQNHRNRDRWSGQYDGGLSAGVHELTAEVECAYVDQKKMIGLNAGDLPKNRWPDARKRWTQSATAPLKVYAANASIVALVAAPERAPRPAGGILIDRLVAQPDRESGKKIILTIKYANGLSIPLSYDVAASINGQLTKLGSLFVVQNGNSHYSGGNQVEAHLDALDPSIKTADIILTPNPSHIEHRPEVSEIWGNKVIHRDVPIERLDLEAGREASGP